jgi:hypothetical protein
MALRRLFLLSCLGVATLLGQGLGPPPAMAHGERVDLQGGRPRALPPALERRQDFQATPCDSRVLVTGGSSAPTTEWLEERTSTSGPALVHARSGHRALRLGDGRILLLGGTEPAQPAECSDAGLTRFLTLPGEARFGLSAEALLLGDGRVLLVDGATGRAWLWDGSRPPVAAGTLVHPRLMFRLLLLPDGRVLVTGGLPVRGTATLPAEVFQPKGQRWTTLKAPLAPRARHNLTLLPGGQVLLWGGHGLDPSRPTQVMEQLDPAKDLVAAAGSLHPGWGVLPALARLADGRLALQADGGQGLVLAPEVRGLTQLLSAPPAPGLPTANAYLEVQLVPSGEGLVLLGTPRAGPSLERWDPRTRACQPLGVLRPGTEGLVTLPDKRILALGPVVDVLDVRTGTLSPLGWREDLVALLRKARGPDTPTKAFAVLPKGMVLRAHLLVPLDKTRALLVGGGPEATSRGTALWIFEPGRRSIKRSGDLGTPRGFQGRPGEGALRAPDGSVLVWGGE